MERYLGTELFELIKYHCSNDFVLDKNIDIRFIKVLKAYKIRYLKKSNPWFLVLFGNDFVDFTENGIIENHICFYSINLKNTKCIYLVGIEFKYYENGTKSETKFYQKVINPILNNLLKSKYDISYKQ
ncbi:MAG: hypothetical protein O9297_03230 [Flavobacterium sp.]|uniref:hypothetical protein n=1 Tax=Flavobacterium sp. TaxID=239 RepID=UPI0022BE400F|nr:hypothetical protein [Flavobacterium sp.]MCZ8296214.1 hypothetical protein [Flavobacterium sp.]